MLLPCRTKLIELNSIVARQYVARPLKPNRATAVEHGKLCSSSAWFQTSHYCRACRTQFINYKYIRMHFKSSLNRFLFISFVFRNSYIFHSTELNSTSETKSCYSRVKLSQLRTAVAQRLKQACFNGQLKGLINNNNNN